MDSAPFQRWMKSPRTTRIRIGPGYLLSRKGLCSRCHDHSKVYGLGTSQLTCSPGQEKHVGFFTLFHIIRLPKDFYSELQQHCLTFFMRCQKNGSARLENHCLCGKPIGDTLLHRPGPNSFRPLTAEQAEEIQCSTLSIPIKGLIQCQWRANPMLLNRVEILNKQI